MRLRPSLAILASALLLATSCGVSAPTTLYYWGGSSGTTSAYDDASYRLSRKQSPEAVCRLICVYEDMVRHPGGSRQVPPPGICAEYAYLLLLPETATSFGETATREQMNYFEGGDYATLFAERAEQMIQMEMDNYPESVPFLSRLLGRPVKD